MSRNCRRYFWGMLLALVMVCGTGCPPDYVFFADDALESAIRAEIGKPLGFLTAGDLWTFSRLTRAT